MEELHDVALLKRLAKQAELRLPQHITANPRWREAYFQLARGAGLLWRLLEQSGTQEQHIDR